MEPAVFLDRDNTLIANDGDLGDPALVRLLPGVPAALRALRDAGFRLVVVTNQAGVARGRYSEDDVDAVHQRIAELVDRESGGGDLIDRFYYCPYHPEATVDEYRRDHSWRKPNAGMLLQAARDMKLDLGRCWMIGDQPRDMEAGRRAGCRTILIGPAASETQKPAPDALAPDFGAAARIVIRATSNGRTPSPAPAEPKASPPAAPPRSAPAAAELGTLRDAIDELVEEMRLGRLRRAEFGAARIAAGLGQLLVVLFAMLALLQLANPEGFLAWMLGAVLVQLATIAVILLDLRG